MTPIRGSLATREISCRPNKGPSARGKLKAPHGPRLHGKPGSGLRTLSPATWVLLWAVSCPVYLYHHHHPHSPPLLLPLQDPLCCWYRVGLRKCGVGSNGPSSSPRKFYGSGIVFPRNKRSPSWGDKDFPAFSGTGTELLFLNMQAWDQNQGTTCSNADPQSPHCNSLDPDTCTLYCFPIWVPIPRPIRDAEILFQASLQGTSSASTS